MRILRALTSEAQTCGCLLGIYETYSGDVVKLVDSTGRACRAHRVGQRVDSDEASTQDPPGFSMARRSA